MIQNGQRTSTSDGQSRLKKEVTNIMKKKTDADVVEDFRHQDEATLFLKELFGIDDIKVARIGLRNFDIYMTDQLVLWCLFDGETLEIAKPQNMSIKKRFVIKDNSISKIRKCIEDLWVDNYANLAKDG